MKANILQLFRLVDSGIPLPFGAVNNSRSMISLGNLVSSVRSALTHAPALGQTFLVADGAPLSTPALVRQISSALRRPARLIRVQPGLLRAAAGMIGRADQMDKLIGDFSLDIQLIERTIGWRPVQTVAQGIEEAASWYRSRTSRRPN